MKALPFKVWKCHSKIIRTMWILDHKILYQLACNHTIQNTNSKCQVWFEINIFNMIGIYRISSLSERLYSRRFWRGIDSNRIFSSDSNWIWSSDSEPIDVKNTKTTLMLIHPAIGRLLVNLPKINDRYLLKQFESNLNSTEELCKKIKTISNP